MPKMTYAVKCKKTIHNGVKVRVWLAGQYTMVDDKASRKQFNTKDEARTELLTMPPWWKDRAVFVRITRYKKGEERPIKKANIPEDAGIHPLNKGPVLVMIREPLHPTRAIKIQEALPKGSLVLSGVTGGTWPLVAITDGQLREEVERRKLVLSKGQPDAEVPSFRIDPKVEIIEESGDERGSFLLSPKQEAELQAEAQKVTSIDLIETLTRIGCDAQWRQAQSVNGYKAQPWDSLTKEMRECLFEGTRAILTGLNSMMGGASCIDLDAIERRTVGPTRGPFDIHRYDNDGGDIRYQLQQSDSAFPKDDDGINIVLTDFSDIDLPNAKQNAEFYAHALMDVIALCAELRRAWATIATQVVAWGTVAAQEATIAKLTGENEISASLTQKLTQKLGVLSAMLNTLGLPDDPKALAREINNLREDIVGRAANQVELVAKLDKDKKRMSWLIENELVPEGFACMASDRYDVAAAVAAERGRDIPNDDDCIEGFWRVVDIAMEAEAKTKEG